MGWLLILCLQFFLCTHVRSSSSHFLCRLDDSSSLLQFKASFNIDTTDTNCGKLAYAEVSTWQNGTDCCSWLGVCYLCNGLQGMIHPNSTLFHLSHLQTLNLAHNRLFPTQLSSQFGAFVNLTHLDLSDTKIQGEVSSYISHLSKLVSLDLSMNDDLKWIQEVTLKRLLQNATSLTELVFDHTNMSFIAPSSFFSFLNLSSLVAISLKGIGLSGNMMSNENTLCLPKLQELYMSANFDLRGQLPKLSCSISLTVLDISQCQFQGSILQFFSNLTQLTFLSLSGNNVGGELPPSWLTSLKQLTLMDFSGNKLIGRIPDVFGGLTKLKTLNFKNNCLEGQIPSSLFHLTSLSYLDCSSNKLEGYLPNKITVLSNLTALWLNNNTLKGTIPSWSLSLPYLVDLDLSNNQFTGHISTAISSHSLEYMFLCNNMLQGNIPESLFNLVNLTNLCLSSNNLSGFVNFKLFSKFQNLESLSLSQNSQLSVNFESDSDYLLSV
ncbi:LRR receptor-like kinase [Medicago truncatula]|uniref:LRR receptor-like kinase n=1 Tax=Medicago truncatula TaxID=3880 RepID=G7K4H0_MEDTR|nr:LRR receptor-like kinase [Medicago truncatula]